MTTTPTPTCPHHLCGRPMLPTRHSGLFECPHVHRARSVRLVDEPDYFAPFFPPDTGAKPNHQPKSSSGPFDLPPDHGPLLAFPPLRPGRKRGQV
jgi:hypothetical protein